MAFPLVLKKKKIEMGQPYTRPIDLMVKNGDLEVDWIRLNWSIYLFIFLIYIYLNWFSPLNMWHSDQISTILSNYSNTSHIKLFKFHLTTVGQNTKMNF